MLGRVFRSLMRSAPARPGFAPDVAPQPRLAAAPAALPNTLAHRIAMGLQLDIAENFDAERWGSPEAPAYRDAQARLAEECMGLLLDHPQLLQEAWPLFVDDVSRQWLEMLLAFRILGHRRLRLPSNTPQHWESRARAAALAGRPSRFIGPFGQMGVFEVEHQGCLVRLDAYPGNVAWTFMLGQYAFDRGGVRIAPGPGNVVIDAGACFGDTALAFAASCGASGHVHSFEIDPGNLGIARHNLTANPDLAARVTLNDSALGVRADTLYLHGSGPGARVLADPSDHPVAVTSIDDYAAANGLPRVDFIKMDVEGAEFDALRGAIKTLQQWRPCLAISVYHHAADLLRIPIWLSRLGLGYQLFLEHYTIHHEETVLYARPAPQPGQS